MSVSEEVPNWSNKVLTSSDILLNHSLVEGVGVADWWITQVKGTRISTERREVLRRNFPNTLILRRVLMGLAWSFPMPFIGPSDEVESEDQREKLQARIDELLGRPTWEGNKDFFSALPWWRFFVLVDGDLFFKYPQADDAKTVLPERMPAENVRIILSGERRKVAVGFEFRYKVLSGLETDPDGSYEVVERYYAPSKRMVDGRMVEVPSSWVVVQSPEYPEGFKEQYPEWPFVLASHLAWEERFNHPRGLPLIERLKQKALHLYSVMMDRRDAGKFAGQKMFVRKNAQGQLPAIKQGAVIDIKDLDPTRPADLKSLDVSTDDTMLRNEYIDALRELYAEAWLMSPIDEAAGAGANAQSGAAMRQSSKDAMLYKTAFTQAEGQFYKDIISKVLTMEGEPVLPSMIRCDYDFSVEPDPTQRRADAMFYEDAGYHAEALRAMGKEDEEIEELMAEREEARAAAMLSDKSGLKPGPEDEEPEAEEDDLKDEPTKSKAMKTEMD